MPEEKPRKIAYTTFIEQKEFARRKEIFTYSFNYFDPLHFVHRLCIPQSNLTDFRKLQLE